MTTTASELVNGPWSADALACADGSFEGAVEKAAPFPCSIHFRVQQAMRSGVG